MTKEVQYKVGMTCGGCSKAVTKILSKIEGIPLKQTCLSSMLIFLLNLGVGEIDADVETKTVKVKCEDPVDEASLTEVRISWL